MRGSPPIIALLLLAFAVNVTALALTGGMLPIVAKDHFGFDERGLGMMVAIFAGGALLGSLTLAAFMNARRPAKTMLVSVVIWHVLLGVFVAAEQPSVGLAVLGLAGFLSSFTMVPMSTYLMVAIEPEYRGRVMGVRQLAVFGLPIGLLAAGALVEPHRHCNDLHDLLRRRRACRRRTGILLVASARQSRRANQGVASWCSVPSARRVTRLGAHIGRDRNFQQLELVRRRGLIVRRSAWNEHRVAGLQSHGVAAFELKVDPAA